MISRFLGMCFATLLIVFIFTGGTFNVGISKADTNGILSVDELDRIASTLTPEPEPIAVPVTRICK